LRRALSTPHDEVTRKDLSNRTGIPEASIKDIETGVYKMTPDVAMRVSLGTGVDPDSLMRGDEQLRDVLDLPLTRASKKPQALGWSEELTESISLLFVAILTAAKEKNALRQFHFLFDAWISEIVPALRIENEVFKQLNKIGDRLDPDFSVPEAVLPREAKAKKRWFESRQKLKDELEAEIALLWLANLQANQEYQTLFSPSEQEAYAAELKMRIRNPADYRETNAEREQSLKEFVQRILFLRKIESATEERKVKLSAALSSLVDSVWQLRGRVRRQALERIAARKRPA
jgi:transcriptional regulator with XRE-family HTH domain